MSLTRSRFYAPVLELLQEKAPQPMLVSEIINAIIVKYPENRNHWVDSSGGVRALLLRMSQRKDSPICLLNGSNPPKFFIEQTQSNSIIPPAVHSNSGQVSSAQINSIFYKPACNLLKQAYPNSMSANEIMRAIVEQYPELEWSHSQGPVRAMLLSAAKKDNSHIEQIPDVLPPRFKYRELSFSHRHNESEVEASPEEIMGNAFAQTQTALKKELFEIIKKMEFTPFEHLANRLVAKILFGESEDTPPSHDGGLDGLVQISSDPLGLNVVGVQAKHYTAGNVQRQEIQQFIGALHGKNGVFVTCSKFSAGAKREAEIATPSKIILINGEQLLDYMVKYKVGVHETGTSYTLSKIDKDFFDEL